MCKHEIMSTCPFEAILVEIIFKSSDYVMFSGLKSLIPNGTNQEKRKILKHTTFLVGKKVWFENYADSEITFRLFVIFKLEF